MFDDDHDSPEVTFRGHDVTAGRVVHGGCGTVVAGVLLLEPLSRAPVPAAWIYGPGLALLAAGVLLYVAQGNGMVTPRWVVRRAVFSPRYVVLTRFTRSRAVRVADVRAVEVRHFEATRSRPARTELALKLPGDRRIRIRGDHTPELAGRLSRLLEPACPVRQPPQQPTPEPDPPATP